MRPLLVVPLVAALVACDGAGAAKAPTKPQPSFSIPYGIVVAPGGTLFIADGGHGRVLRYDPARKRVVVYARGLREPAGLERAPTERCTCPTSRAIASCASIGAGG